MTRRVNLSSALIALLSLAFYVGVITLISFMGYLLVTWVLAVLGR
jgi:uncharacterized membrane protein (DUF485 family)